MKAFTIVWLGAILALVVPVLGNPLQAQTGSTAAAQPKGAVRKPCWVTLAHPGKDDTADMLDLSVVTSYHMAANPVGEVKLTVRDATGRTWHTDVPRAQAKDVRESLAKDIERCAAAQANGFQPTRGG